MEEALQDGAFVNTCRHHGRGQGATETGEIAKNEGGHVGVGTGIPATHHGCHRLGRTAWDGVSKGVIARCVLRAVVVGISLTLCGFATARGLTVA